MNLISGRQKLWTWLAIGLAVISLAAGLAFYRPFKPDSDLNVAQAGPKPPPLPGKSITFLVMGVDKRPDDSGRSDSMMVVSYDPEEQQVSALSLPRDTWVQIPGHGYDKLNHAYAFGGDKLAVATVQGLLGIPIDHYVTISFQGFARIIDALGGVEIDAEKRMEYVDPFDTGMGPDGLVIDIKPGPQHMDGITALKYARYRMDDEGDFGRMRRQQQVATAMMKSAQQPGVITKIPQLVGALNDALDTDLSVAEMVRLATGAKGAINRPLKTGALGGTPKTIGGIYYLIPDLSQERLTAYDVLVGGTPSDAFVSRTKEDQTQYAATVAEAMAADETAGSAVAEAPGTGGGTPSAPPSGDGKSTPSPQQPQGPGGGTARPPKQPSRPQQKPQPITIAVMDGTGKGLGPTYVQKLKAAGFRVALIGKLTKPISQTVAIDHAGQPGTAERIHGVLPGALIIAAPDAKADEAIEIMLGTDLVPSTP